MKLLGLTHPISWNTAACALDGSQLLFFMEEERLIRYKHAPNIFPNRAISISEQLLGEDFEIAVGFDLLQVPEIRALGGGGISHALAGSTETYRWALGQAEIAHRFSGKRLHFIDHHVAHAYSVIAQNAFEPGLVLSLDGWGGAWSGLVARWDGTNLAKLTMIPPDHSLGAFYTAITSFCGFRPHSSEGTLMGLAALGEHIHELPETLFDSSTSLPFSDVVKQYLSRHQRPETEIQKAAWARTAQHYFERALNHLVTNHLSADDRTIMLSGGCALNCTANGRLAELHPDRRLVVQPASTDAGTAFGAAVAVAMNNGVRVPFSQPYLGLKARRDTELSASHLTTRAADPDLIVDRLVKGQVVGICDGRDEIGPRALCNRSLVAGAHDPHMRDTLNKIKRRQWWRPVAPVTTESLVDKCLRSRTNADLRFMNVAGQASDLLRDKGPSCVHLDGSIRVQVLDTAHPLHPVITSYFDRTGVPALGNTSFNIGTEPIVHSFEDAMRTFLFEDRISNLYCDGWLASKQD